MSDPIRTLLARVKELDEKATGGEWSARELPVSVGLNNATLHSTAGDPETVWSQLPPEIGATTAFADAEMAAEYRTAAPALARALEAVLEVHYKTPIYEWCSYTGNSGCEWGAHIELSNGEWGHPDIVEAWTCNECYDEDNISGDIPDWPCPTVQAITEHLGDET